MDNEIREYIQGAESCADRDRYERSRALAAIAQARLLVSIAESLAKIADLLSKALFPPVMK